MPNVNNKEILRLSNTPFIVICSLHQKEVKKAKAKDKKKKSEAKKVEE